MINNQYINERIGRIIRLGRKDIKMTQSELGEFVGCKKANISKIELGKRNITVGTFLDIADTLGIEIRINNKRIF